MGEKIRCVMCGKEERQQFQMTEEAISSYHCSDCSAAMLGFYLREGKAWIADWFRRIRTKPRRLQK
jgi:hypothetical protein